MLLPLPATECAWWVQLRRLQDDPLYRATVGLIKHDVKLASGKYPDEVQREREAGNLDLDLSRLMWHLAAEADEPSLRTRAYLAWATSTVGRVSESDATHLSLADCLAPSLLASAGALAISGQSCMSSPIGVRHTAATSVMLCVVFGNLPARCFRS